MRNWCKSLLLVLGMSVTSVASASDLGVCMVDSLNGKERKTLAKWIFFAMAAHPEIESYAKVTKDNREASDQYIGELVTRLLVEDCPKQLKSALTLDPLALEKSFELVGQVAMQELVNHEKVTLALINYAKYADMKEIEKLTSGN